VQSCRVGSNTSQRGAQARRRRRLKQHRGRSLCWYVLPRTSSYSFPHAAPSLGSIAVADGLLSPKPRLLRRATAMARRRMRKSCCCPTPHWMLMRADSDLSTRRFCLPCLVPARPHRLARSRTPPFHGGNRGSNPLGVAFSHSARTGPAPRPAVPGPARATHIGIGLHRHQCADQCVITSRSSILNVIARGWWIHFADHRDQFRNRAANESACELSPAGVILKASPGGHR
jgi:hypothetical protein